MTTPHVRTFDPDSPRRLLENRVIPAWASAREAQPDMERAASLDAERKKAKDDELITKYGMDNR